MPEKTFAVAMFTVQEARWLAPAASTLARTFGAHLTGIHATQPITRYSGEAIDAMAEFAEWQRGETEEIRKVFDAATGAAGISAEFRAQTAGRMDAEDYLLDGVRAADIVLLARTDRHGWLREGARFQELIIRHSGRPVLVLPEKHCLTAAARHLVIGVAQTREATRAVHDALMLAQPGAKIDLLSVGGGGTEPLVLDFRQDLAACLDRRGYKVDLLDRYGDSGTAGEVLLQTAFEQGADLLVTGAFGHSRMFDFVIGAVTSMLLEKAEMPVLMSK